MHQLKIDRYSIVGLALVATATAVAHWGPGCILVPRVAGYSFLARLPFWGLAALLALPGPFFLLARIEAKRRAAPRLALLAGSVLLCLTGLEAALRVLTPAPVFHPQLALYPYRNLRLNVDLPGVARTVVHTSNAWGMRGDPVPRDWNRRFTIVTVGGSTTVCWYLPDDKTWPCQLQARLRPCEPSVVVQNAGVDGHTTRGHVMMMREVVAKVKPKMVIFLVGVNDLKLSLIERRRRLGVQFDASGPGWLFCHSRLVQVANTWHRIVFNEATVVKSAWNKAYVPTPLMDPDPLPDDLRTLLPQLPEFRDNVCALIRLARECGATPVFCTQPIIFEDNEYWAGIQGKSCYSEQEKPSVSAAVYRRLLDIYNQTLTDLCREANVTCIDLAATVSGRRDWMYDDCHFNEPGAAVVADTVAQSLRDAGLVGATGPRP